MQSSCKIQIYDKKNNPWQNLYHIPYHPSTYVSQRAFRGLILASLFDIGCDTDFAKYSSLYSMSNKLTFLLITFCLDFITCLLPPYCRYSVKLYPINQSINQSINVSFKFWTLRAIHEVTPQSLVIFKVCPQCENNRL